MDFILFSVQTMVLTIGINHGMPIRHLVVWSWDDSVLVSSLSIVDTLRETETYGSAKSLLQKSCRQLKCMLIKWNGWKTDLIIGTTALLDPSNPIIFFSYMLRSFLWSVHHPIDSWDWWKRSSVHKRIGKNEIWWCKSVCAMFTMFFVYWIYEAWDYFWGICFWGDSRYDLFVCLFWWTKQQSLAKRWH